MRLIYILSQLQQIKAKEMGGDKIKIYIYFTAAALRCAMAIKSSPSKWHSTPFFFVFYFLRQKSLINKRRKWSRGGWWGGRWVVWVAGWCVINI